MPEDVISRCSLPGIRFPALLSATVRDTDITSQFSSSGARPVADRACLPSKRHHESKSPRVICSFYRIRTRQQQQNWKTQSTAARVRRHRQAGTPFETPIQKVTYGTQHAISHKGSYYSVMVLACDGTCCPLAKRYCAS